MKAVRWLQKAEVLAIHESVVRLTAEPVELLSDHLLESALAKPHNLSAYADPDFFDLAASYAEGICRNHAFANGNKRSGFLGAVLFLKVNGTELAPERDNEHTEAIEKLAQGLLDRAAFAQHIRDHGTSH